MELLDFIDTMNKIARLSEQHQTLYRKINNIKKSGGISDYLSRLRQDPHMGVKSAASSS